MSQNPDFANLIEFFEHCKPILPDVSPEAHARINATRERCDALVEKAQRQQTKLLREASRMGDGVEAAALRKRASEVLQTAQDEAAVRMLDAQADEYLPLTGEYFPYQTLRVLANTSTELYGGVDAVVLQEKEWRARWWDQKGAKGAKEAKREEAVVIDPVFWRELREDFQSLGNAKFSLTWRSQPSRNSADEHSQWIWSPFYLDSSRARLCAIARRGAKALGYNSEYDWFDELRKADFVRFKLTGRGHETQSDGTILEFEAGSIDDVLRECVTLCYILESGSVASATDGSRDERRTVHSSKSRKNTIATSAESIPEPTNPSGKKRGRPQTIPDEKKTAALELKRSGGTYKEAAAVLYDTKYPTPQQTKNAATILRLHKQRSHGSDSRGNTPQRSPKPGKPTG